MNFSEISWIEGWCPEAKALAMFALIRRVKPSLCVELGVYGGRSLAATALALRENGSGVAVGVDPFEESAAAEGMDGDHLGFWKKELLDGAATWCGEAISRLRLWPWVRLVGARSDKAALLFDPDSIGVLHIDRNHSEERSLSDVRLYLPLVAPGGHIWVDDTDWPTLSAAVSLLNAECILVEDFGSYRLYKKTEEPSPSR
jgi:hypothetical protein